MIAFVLTAVGLSLSGVLAPGPITAATLAAGLRSRHAGALVALGHIAVEAPAIALLALGLGGWMERPLVHAGVALAGGGFLLVLGVQLLHGLRRPQEDAAEFDRRHPFWTGAVLTATSPYFWIWAATVGLNLTGRAMEIGAAALVLLAAVHWLCDVGWLEVLSLAGFKGSQAFGPRSQQVVSALCGIALVGFGLMFLWDAMANGPRLGV